MTGYLSTQHFVLKLLMQTALNEGQPLPAIEVTKVPTAGS